jgi:hypothetical protein
MMCIEHDYSTLKRFDSVLGPSISTGPEGNSTPPQKGITVDPLESLSDQKQSAITPLKASACAGSIAIGVSTLKVLISCMSSISGNTAKRSVGLLDYFSGSIQQLRKSKTVINVFIHRLFAGYRMETFYLIFAAWKTCTDNARVRKGKLHRDTKNCLQHAFSEWRVFATRQRDLSESASAIASEVGFVILLVPHNAYLFNL